MGRLYDVLHVGIICADMPLKIPYDTIDFSMDAIQLEEISICPGGDATNAAQVMARLGKKVALAAKAGDDSFGRIIVDKVKDSGVDTKSVSLDPGARTSISVVLINGKGDRSFLVHPGSMRNFSFKDIDTAVVKMARHVNFGSFFAHPKMDRGGAEELFRIAKEAGATTSADATHDGFGTGFEGIKGSLRYVDYFFPSYIEGRYLTGETEPERIADHIIRETGDKTVVIKLGDEGCYVKSHGKCISSRPYEVDAVDTTGAGDNFVAGFLTGLTNGWDVERCADFANAVAAFSVRHIGATTEKMSMDNIQVFMENTPRR